MTEQARTRRGLGPQTDRRTPKNGFGKPARTRPDVQRTRWCTSPPARRRFRIGEPDQVTSPVGGGGGSRTWRAGGLGLAPSTPCWSRNRHRIWPAGRAALGASSPSQPAAEICSPTRSAHRRVGRRATRGDQERVARARLPRASSPWRGWRPQHQPAMSTAHAASARGAKWLARQGVDTTPPKRSPRNRLGRGHPPLCRAASGCPAVGRARAAAAILGMCA